jgi:sulfur relay (sulfurtransferase) complex TusBCD TusD component (DsrE family)
MRIGIILETNEPEKAWNALRFANTAVRQKHEVKVFLMSAGVEVESIVDEKFNVKKQLDEFLTSNGVVLACGTCIKSRQQKESEACPISTMIDCLNMVEWADKAITF